MRLISEQWVHQGSKLNHFISIKHFCKALNITEITSEVMKVTKPADIFFVSATIEHRIPANVRLYPIKQFLYQMNTGYFLLALQAAFFSFSSSHLDLLCEKLVCEWEWRWALIMLSSLSDQASFSLYRIWTLHHGRSVNVSRSVKIQDRKCLMILRPRAQIPTELKDIL